MPKATPALEITTAETSTPKPRKRGGRPVAVEEHTVVTKWAEEKKVGAVAPKARKASPVADEFEEDNEEPEETEMPDSAHALFEEYGFDEGLMMDINRLPDYTLNRRTDPVSWQWVTMMPFTPLFKQEIALRHARQGEANWFLIVLKDQNGRIIRREDGKGRIGPFSVEAASNEERIANGLPPHPPQANVTVTTNQATAMPYPMQPIIPQQSVTERIAEVAQIFSVFKDMGLIPKAQPNPQPVQTETRGPVDGKLAVAQMLLEDPQNVKQMVSGIMGLAEGGVPKSGVTEMLVSGLIDFVHSVGPTVAPSIANYFNAKAQAEQYRAHQFQQQIQQAPPSLPEGIQGQPVPANFQPEPSMQQSAPPEQAMPPQEPDYDLIFFGHILELCKRRKFNTPEIAINDIFEFIKQGESVGGYNVFHRPMDVFVKYDAELLLNAAAAENPIAAKMASEPDVLPWLKQVQDEIRKEWANDGEDNQAN